MALDTLRDVLCESVKDLYNAENQLLKALPKMAKAASSPELKEAFTSHLEETKGQVARLEKVCGLLKIEPKGKVCKAMKGLIEEGSEVMEEEGSPAGKDAALIEAAQKVEHYEIAGYGTCRTFATVIGETEVASLLQETLDEEGAADKKLTEIAETGLNADAADDEESDEDEDEEEDEDDEMDAEEDEGDEGDEEDEEEETPPAKPKKAGTTPPKGASKK